MSPNMDLTLIVAATRSMGIGVNGSLPWSRLEKEMAYFARVTKRLPPNVRNRQTSAMNALVMGRTTWESIPTKFRPLQGRVNIVVSRSYPDLSFSGPIAVDFSAQPVKAASLEQALGYLQSSLAGSLGRVFVIGGSQLYGATLALPETRRVLLTSILSDFDCDTFFPLQLPPRSSSTEWIRMPKESLDEWVGEEVPAGIQEENGICYEFQMWERSEDRSI